MTTQHSGAGSLGRVGEYNLLLEHRTVPGRRVGRLPRSLEQCSDLVADGVRDAIRLPATGGERTAEVVEDVRVLTGDQSRAREWVLRPDFLSRLGDGGEDDWIVVEVVVVVVNIIEIVVEIVVVVDHVGLQGRLRLCRLRGASLVCTLHRLLAVARRAVTGGLGLRPDLVEERVLPADKAECGLEKVESRAQGIVPVEPEERAWWSLGSPDDPRIGESSAVQLHDGVGQRIVLFDALGWESGNGDGCLLHRLGGRSGGLSLPLPLCRAAAWLRGGLFLGRPLARGSGGGCGRLDTTKGQGIRPGQVSNINMHVRGLSRR